MCGVWVGIAGFSVMLHYVGVRMTWFGYFTPMMICPGILPLIFTVTWNRQTYWAAFISPLVGFVVGLAVWVSTAYHFTVRSRLNQPVANCQHCMAP